MAHITIVDLAESDTLDREAAKSVHGGVGLLLPAVQKVRERRRGRGYLGRRAASSSARVGLDAYGNFGTTTLDK